MKSVPYFAFLFLLLTMCTHCSNNEIPKPKGEVRLTYPVAKYELFSPDCPYKFEKNIYAQPITDSNCWYTITYPHMKADIYLTYSPVHNDLIKLLKESEKLTFQHSIRASGIKGKIFEIPAHKVYGTYYELKGNSASNIQFHATDSIHHLLTGTVYFHAAPNHDSLKPAVKYVNRDILKLIETLEWK